MRHRARESGRHISVSVRDDVQGGAAEGEGMKLKKGDLSGAVYGFISSSRAEKDKNRRTGDFWEKGWWSISSTGHCFRKQVMERAGKDVFPFAPKSPDSLLVFSYGDMIESLAYEALRKKYADFRYQIPVKLPELKAQGTADFLVRAGGKIIVIDAKSASKSAFGWAERENGKKDNKLQITTYCMGLNADESVLLYVDKEYGKLFEAWFDWKDHVYEVKEYYKTLNKYWAGWEAKKALPPEVPLEEARDKYNKHVKAGRCRAGESCPHPLCSPLYCEALTHCPTIKEWWNTYGG